MTDILDFGDAASEKAHGLNAQNSDVITGSLGQSARQLLPLQPQTWEGGKTLMNAPFSNCRKRATEPAN